MKKLIICLFVFSALSCGDLTDFTTVVNPNLSQESVLGQPNSSVIWLTGMERQLSIVINEVVINAEIASDNYNNDQTFYNQFLDNLESKIIEFHKMIRDITLLNMKRIVYDFSKNSLSFHVASICISYFNYTYWEYIYCYF